MLRLIPEPIAAAIEYFGVKKEKNSNIVVFDLGGGTLDVALVRANASYAGIPYEVIDQQGNRSLGGDDWDAKFAERLKTLYVKETGNTVTKRIEEALTLEARIIKEELTKNDKYINDMEIKGEYIPVEVTRAEFEKDTRPLLLKARETVLQLMNRVKNEKIDHVILTGGSCYMPQIKAELENLCKTGTFPGNPDVLMVEPEHAIAYGAARYAATLNFPKPVAKPGPDPEPDPYRIITMRATHRYTNSEGSYVDFLIKKGQKLPVVAKTKSYTRFENQKESVFAVYESDYMGTEPVYDKSIWGENVMTITLKRTETRIPKGRESEQTLTLTEDGIITCRCVDQVSGKSVENKVVLKRQI